MLDIAVIVMHYLAVADQVLKEVNLLVRWYHRPQPQTLPGHLVIMEARTLHDIACSQYFTQKLYLRL